MNINLSEYYSFNFPNLAWAACNPLLLSREDLLKIVTPIMQYSMVIDLSEVLEGIENKFGVSGIYQSLLPKFPFEKENDKLEPHLRREFSFRLSPTELEKVPKEILDVTKVWASKWGPQEKTSVYLTSEVSDKAVAYRWDIKDKYEFVCESSAKKLPEVFGRNYSTKQSKPTTKQSLVSFKVEDKVYDQCDQNSVHLCELLDLDHIFKFLSVGAEGNNVQLIQVTENISWTILPINKAHELLR